MFCLHPSVVYISLKARQNPPILSLHQSLLFSHDPIVVCVTAATKSIEPSPIPHFSLFQKYSSVSNTLFSQCHFPSSSSSASFVSSSSSSSLRGLVNSSNCTDMARRVNTTSYCWVLGRRRKCVDTVENYGIAGAENLFDLIL